MHKHLRWTTLVVAGAVSSVVVSAQSAPPSPTPKPPATLVTPTAPATKPPTNTRATTGPGTQTEDDVYVGVKRTVQGTKSPTTSGKPQVRSGAGVSPNNGGNVSSGGDDDLDDLEVERRTVQNVERPSAGTPQPRPTAGTSPNTGRTAGTAPTPPRTPTGGVPPARP